MAEQNNNPIGGNYNGNTISISGLMDAINHLDATQTEVINALKTIANSKSSGINANELKKAFKDALKENEKSNSNRPSYNYDTKNISKHTLTYIKDMDKASDAFGNIKQVVDKLSKDLEKQGNLWKGKDATSVFKDFKSHIGKLNDAIKESYKQTTDIDKEYRKKLAEGVTKINGLRERIIRQNNYYENVQTDLAKERILAKRKALEEELRQTEAEQAFTEDEYNQKQNNVRRELKLKADELNKFESLASQRIEIEDRNNQLLSNSQRGFNESITKLRDSFNPKRSSEYLSKMGEATKTEEVINAELEAIEHEEALNDELIANANEAIKKFEDDILKYDRLLKDESRNATESQKDFWTKSKADAVKSRNEQVRKQQELAEVKKNNKEQRKILEENKKANKKYMENLDKEYTAWQKIGNKLGDTISKILTSATTRQLDLLKSAADNVFNTLESTQKSLGKTLKMSTGAYQEYIDKVQEAAKEAGIAISSNQVLELSATMAEMGLRDENLIKTFAIEQAKMQEAGVGSIVQLNEETIRMYKNTYNDLIRSGLTEDQASKALTEQLDKLIAIESTVADEFGNVDALANGGFTEIQNLTNQLVKSGSLNAEQREEFEYQLARGMQTIAETGADPSNFLSDIQTLLTSTESNLSPELLSILSGNTASTIDQFSNATVDMINRYLQQNKSIYGNLNLTDAKYVAEAYGASGTVQDKMALAKAEQLQGKKLEALDTNTKKIQKDLQEGTYLTATEEMEKKQLEVMQDIAQMMQKIPDGQFWMDTGLDAGRSWLSSLGSLLASLIGGLVSSGFGRGAQSLSGNSSKLGQFLTGGGESGWATAAKALTSIGGLGIASYSFGKSLYNGESLEDALIDDTFTSGLGMAIGGAVAGPLGGLFGAAVAKYGVPEMRKGTTALLERAFGGTDDLAQESFELMKEAGEDLKNSANTLYDSANKQLEALQKEEAEMTKFSTIQKRDWLQQKEQELKTMGILKPEESIGDLSNAKSIDEAFEKYSEKYKDVKGSDITTAMGGAELASTLSNIYGSRTNLTSDSAFKTSSGYNSSDLLQLMQTGKITEEQYQEGLQEIYKQEGSQLLTAMSEYEGSAQGFSNTIASYMATGLTKEEAISKYATEANMDDRQASQLLGAYSTLEERKARYEKINKLFQDTYKQAHSNAGSDNTLAIEQAFASLSPIDISTTMIKGTPKKSIDVEDLKNSLINGTTTFASVDTFSDVPVLNTVNGTYVGYKTGLDYVPYDNYLALLHRGEKVLNESEAQSYRTDTTVSFDSINNTLVAQTDRIENILKQIYNAILYIGKGSNTSSLNPNIVNMVSGIATM